MSHAFEEERQAHRQREEKAWLIFLSRASKEQRNMDMDESHILSNIEPRLEPESDSKPHCMVLKLI